MNAAETYGNMVETNRLLQHLAESGGKALSITTRSATLEDIFVRLVDKSNDLG
ncbi:MAG: hypothetical protein ACE5Q6_26580 [Dehalococcoidia bacterium]